MVQHEGGGVEGNILSKSDVPGGAYTYGAGKSGTGSTAAGPHAVVSAGGNSYAYDANGNLLSVTDAQSNVTRTVEWTSFNKPSYIHAGALGTAEGSRFFHGPDRARVIQSRIDGIYARTQVHVGGLFEHVTDTNPGRPAEHVHHIAAGGGTVAIYKVRLDANPASDEMLYVHRDHLGSVDTLTDASGEVKESLAFGPWGARRDASDWDGAPTFAVPPPGIVPLGDTPDTTPRGFTGHEHLDNVALVHMNGRIYDPVIGRFLSADPFVQAPGSTQAFNRYTYVNNNPLSYTDPSGFFFKKLFRAAKKILKNKVVRTAIAIGVSFIPGAQTLGVALLKGFAIGFVGSGGDLKAGLLGVVTAGAFHGVGTYFDGLSIANGSGFDAGTPFLSGGQQFAKVVAHGTVGGAASKVSGGSFKDGFLGVGVAQFGAGAIGAIQGPSMIRVVAAAAVGGTASALGGGKFANGAVTAAFGRMFGEGWRGSEGPQAREVRVPSDVQRAVEGTFKYRFGETISVDQIRVIENSEWANIVSGFREFFLGSGIRATTQVDTIYLASNTTAATFFATGKFVLHEYFHVIRQWNSGRMTNLNYLLNPSKWESEATTFASDNIGTYRAILQGR